MSSPRGLFPSHRGEKEDSYWRELLQKLITTRSEGIWCCDNWSNKSILSTSAAILDCSQKSPGRYGVKSFTQARWPTWNADSYMARAWEIEAVGGSRYQRWTAMQRFQSRCKHTLMLTLSESCHTWRNKLLTEVKLLTQWLVRTRPKGSKTQQWDAMSKTSKKPSTSTPCTLLLHSTCQGCLLQPGLTAVRKWKSN